MVRFEAVSLLSIKDENIADTLSKFDCPKNSSVENFIRNNALNSSRQGTSQTHIVIMRDGTAANAVGFFALANKVITVQRESVTKTLFKKVSNFGYYDSTTDSVTFSSPLIAQFGKNFSNGNDRYISGKDLLDLACSKVREAHRIIGGRAVYLECEYIPKLIDFYIDNGFAIFGSRAPGEGDNGDLIQMIKILR
jgi:hypothetical protein